MTLDCNVKGSVSIDMVDHIEKMTNKFPQEELKGPKVASPWNDNLFKVDEKSPLSSPERQEQFHNKTAQGLFLCKRARPDTTPAIAAFATRVQNPNEDDWNKLTCMMKFLKQTKNNNEFFDSMNT